MPPHRSSEWPRTSPISTNATASRRHQQLVALSRTKGYTLFTTNAPRKIQKKYALSGYSVASIAKMRSLADWGRSGWSKEWGEDWFRDTRADIVNEESEALGGRSKRGAA